MGGLFIIVVIFLMLRSVKLIPLSVVKRGADFSRFVRANKGGRLDVSENAASRSKPATQIALSSLSEYVLEGRDEEGVRYLLRISGDKVARGIIIGRNPDDSPYIINHVDVSRRHARLKSKKNRVFIEDLGSTNGTSVNGHNIEGKGPVSIVNGDQIIIGSIVMKLKILLG